MVIEKFQAANLIGRVYLPEVVHSEDLIQTYLLVDEAGNEIAATFSGDTVILDAGANDIRLGKNALNADGVVNGEKIIPSYQTTTGVRAVKPGIEVSLTIEDRDLYNFTKFQAIITKSSTMASELIVINNQVYPAGSDESIATIVVDHETKSINFGITNDSDTNYVIRYFTYKEEY